LLRGRHASDTIVGAVYAYIIAQMPVEVNNGAKYSKTFDHGTSNNLHRWIQLVFWSEIQKVAAILLAKLEFIG